MLNGLEPTCTKSVAKLFSMEEMSSIQIWMEDISSVGIVYIQWWEAFTHVWKQSQNNTHHNIDLFECSRNVFKFKLQNKNRNLQTSALTRVTFLTIWWPFTNTHRKSLTVLWSIFWQFGQALKGHWQNYNWHCETSSLRKRPRE